MQQVRRAAGGSAVWQGTSVLAYRCACRDSGCTADELTVYQKGTFMDEPLRAFDIEDIYALPSKCRSCSALMIQPALYFSIRRMSTRLGTSYRQSFMAVTCKVSYSGVLGQSVVKI